MINAPAQIDLLKCFVVEGTALNVLYLYVSADIQSTVHYNTALFLYVQCSYVLIKKIIESKRLCCLSSQGKFILP